ncbi:hypothetical protein [Antarctobacter jejuensis]|uniref:hypothetical protein n=1 Tax=Antarctobacter jejuensis TaxID=1439938 RepID=UPI003FCF39FA
MIRRGQHGKHHGLVRARFIVQEDVPEELALGVFQPGAQYDCLVRFSNGGQEDDREPDVRGMAIKLLDVPGQKLLPGFGHVREQDFLLVDHPAYFCADMAEYLPFNRHFTPVQALRANGPGLWRSLAAGYGLAMLLLFHRRVLRAAKAFAGRRVGSVLGLTYHSTTPYALGTHAVKYKAIGAGGSAGEFTTEDGLRAALWQALGKAEARFTFGVVIQRNTVRHPVEDASVDWEAAGAEFIPLAELILPRQDNTPEQDAQAESSRFSPWMSLPEHRPLGAINRARRDIYRAMAEARQQ